MPLDQIRDEELRQHRAGQEMAERICGSTVVAIGGDPDGELLLALAKDGQVTEFVIAVDDTTGELSIYELEKQASEPAQAI